MMSRKELYETALRVQRVAQGHIESLEAHIRAIQRVASAHDPTCNGCKTILDIIEGKINIFAADEPVEVVAAVRRLILPDGDKYWVCRRTDGGNHGKLAGMWEYPGGTKEEGETHKEALKREMREEFGVEITFMESEPLDCIISNIPGYAETARVTFYAVAFLTDPELRVHDASKWCTVAELQINEHLPSGQEFNKRLIKGK